jgi:hypothetical protein
VIKVSTTHPNGHLDPDFSMDDVRSKSWKTRLLAPAAFIATVYNPDSPDMDDPTERKHSQNGILSNIQSETNNCQVTQVYTDQVTPYQATDSPATIYCNCKLLIDRLPVRL